MLLRCYIDKTLFYTNLIIKLNSAIEHQTLHIKGRGHLFEFDVSAPGLQSY